jgi:hypothetical protein
MTELAGGWLAQAEFDDAMVQERFPHLTGEHHGHPVTETHGAWDFGIPNVAILQVQ